MTKSDEWCFVFLTVFPVCTYSGHVYPGVLRSESWKLTEIILVSKKSVIVCRFHRQSIVLVKMNLIVGKFVLICHNVWLLRIDGFWVWLTLGECCYTPPGMCFPKFPDENSHDSHWLCLKNGNPANSSLKSRICLRNIFFYRFPLAILSGHTVLSPSHLHQFGGYKADENFENFQKS